MIVWQGIHPDFHAEMLGFIPDFFNEDDPRPAAEQIRERYISGWEPIPGFTMDPDFTLNFPEDPPFKPLARMQLRDETIFFYQYAILAIVQKDGRFEASRVD